MGVIEAVRHRLGTPETGAVEIWKPRQVKEKLELLHHSKIDMVQTLAIAKPIHGHYFPRLQKEPGWLKMAVAMYLAQPTNNSYKFLRGHEEEIEPLYQAYFKSKGFEGNRATVSPPEIGVDYSTPFHVLVAQGEKTWNLEKAINYFEWIDFVLNPTKYKFITHTLDLNTTRDNGAIYSVEFPQRTKEEDAFDNLQLEAEEQQLVIDLLDARVPETKAA